MEDYRMHKAPLSTDHLYPDDKENIAKSTSTAPHSENEDGYVLQLSNTNGYSSSMNALGSRSTAASRASQAGRSNYPLAPASSAMARSMSEEQRSRQHLNPNSSALNVAASRSTRALRPGRVVNGQEIGPDEPQLDRFQRDFAISDDENNLGK
jgi:hypothetical protein